MTELMKRYEAEFEKGLTHACYESWLEAKVLDGKTIEKFQEIIRNQCDEISALKAQLTWRPVSEKPEKIDYYLIRRGSGSIWFKAYFDGERFRKVIDQKLVAVIGTHWLPIPPPEGDKQ